MLKSTLTGFMLPLLLLVGSSSDNSAAGTKQKSTDTQSETIEKLIVASGNVTMDVDLNRLNDTGSATEKSKLETLRFAIVPDSFFTVVVTNNLLRGPLPGSMGLIPQNAANLPALLSASLHQLVLEKKQSDDAYDLVVRDSKSGLVFFNVEGHQYDYDAGSHSLSINGGALLISAEFARQLGHPGEAGAVAGKISLTASMSPIEIQTVANGEVKSAVLPPLRSRANAGAPNAPDAIPPGPDVIVGDLPSMAQFGSSGTQVGLAVGTTSCNNGTIELDWFALTQVDHPVIPQNLYRMSGGTGNNDRFEQVGQSWLKHAFTALQDNACGFGCTPAANGTHLGVGCSDPYDASLNAQQGSGNASGLGSRAWVNPFTGAYPSTAANHTGHTHGGTTHRILVEAADLSTASNPGATYYAEAQYVTPHEYAWCQANPGQCNMYNNASYRQFSVTGTTSFTFATIGSTVRTIPAINAWTGATIRTIEPVPGTDGRAFIAFKVTNPSAGVWHYEYAINNQNLDRGIQSFSVPLGAGVTVSNLGFHAPLNHPGIANDGTLGSAGLSNVAWTSNQAGGAVTWNSETFAQNQNANALRWGTLYNFRFDSNQPPQTMSATIGYYKTGSPTTVPIQGPAVPATPSPTPTATPTSTPIPTPTPAPTPTPGAIVVATLSLPVATIDPSMTNFTQPVVTSAINPADNLIGFQGDFTFNETVVTFQNPPVSNFGLTGGNWNVSGNVLPGAGPIRTLRVSAFSNDFTPLSGAGTLYSLNMTRVSSTTGAMTPLVWKPDPDNFIFIDANLDIHPPGTEPPGSITIQPTTVAISGALSYCSNPVPGPVPNVTLTVTGSASGSALSDGSGNYTLSPLTLGGNYTVTPTKAALLPGAAGISTVDVVGVQRHFLNVTPLPAGCRLAAADVNADTFINTVDVIAVQRFFLGMSTGIANVGKYQFSPANRTYPAISGSQTAQNYDTLIFGDVAGPFADRPGEPSQTVAGDGTGGNEVDSTVAEVALPEVAADQSRSNFNAAVRTTAIDAKNKLVGFQGDFTFDERVVAFQSEPVQKAGLTGGNWNVSGNVLDGPGPIRTLRISAYSNDFRPLSGSGTLFELRMIRVSKAAQSAPLIWAAAPDQFIFIDADLNTQTPGSAGRGR